MRKLPAKFYAFQIAGKLNLAPYTILF